MASSVMQIRVDDELRSQAAEVFERLGIDLPTAVRIFLKRSVLENGIPFRMTLPKEEYRALSAVRAMRELQDSAEQNGIVDMTLDEINAEISEARKAMEERG